MSNLSIDSLLMQDAGFNDDEIKKKQQLDAILMKDAGFNDKEIQNNFGVKDSESDESVMGPIKKYWDEIANGVKEWSVGEKAEWGEYWDRGIGKSTINLATQFHSNGKLGIDAQKVLAEESDDTGHLERWWESISNIASDLPIYIPAALAGGALTGKSQFASGFSAGFVNDSIKTTYIAALQDGKVDTFQEWWKLYIDEGMKAGVKSGLTLGTAMAAPGMIGAKSIISKYATQYAAFIGMGTILEGELPTKNELINTALVLKTFGIIEAAPKATKMIYKRVSETDKKAPEVIEEILTDPKKLEDVVSENIKEFRDKTKPEEKTQEFKEGTEPNAKELLPEEAKTDVTDPLTMEKSKETTIDTALKEITEQNKELKKELSGSEAVNKVLERIELDTPIPKTEIKDVRSYFATMFLDKLHPILKAVRTYEKEGGKFNGNTPYETMRIQPGMIGRGMHFLEYGTLDFATLKTNGKGLLKILEKAKKPKDFAELTAYVSSKRSLEKLKQNKETGIDKAASESVVRELEGKWGETFKDLVDYQNRVVKYLLDSQVINKETFDLIMEANKDYVPFYRVLNEAISDKNAQFGTGVKNPFKGFKGSGEKILNPIESIHLNTLHHVTIAEKNKAFTDFIKMVESKPEAFPEIRKAPPQMQRTKVEPKELEAIVDNPAFLNAKAAEGLVVFRRNGQVVSDTQIAIFRNGKRELWEVGKELASAFNGMNRFQSMMLLRFLGAPARLLRAGATLAPDFFIRNFARDTLSASIFSKNNFIPFYHSMMGFGHLKKSDKLYQDWVKSGAMQSMFVSFDRNYFNKDIQQYLNRGKVHNLINPKNSIEMLRIASEFFESSSRVGDFKLSFNKLKKRKDLTDRDIIEQSGFQSRDITIDFAKMGTTIQAWNMISAFFNARLQGYAKISDAFMQRPIQTSAKVFSYIMLPSILLWMKNHDDERYKALPRWQKDLFWIFITGEGDVKNPNDYTVWRIPKPFELGLLFGTGTEKMLDFAVSKDKNFDMMKDFMKDFGSDIISGLGPMPDFLRPFIENSVNKSFFSDRPIVSRGMEKLLPEFQYNEYTSETSKLLGKAMRELGFGNFSSPAKIDNVINAWTGTLGSYALNVIDKSIIKSGLAPDPVKPSDTLSDIPVIRAFVVRNPSGGSEYISMFYKEYEKIEQELSTANKLIKEGLYERALELYGQAKLDKIPLLAFKEALSKQSSFVRKVYQSREINADDKRQLIDQTYLLMIDLAKTALDLTKEEQ